MLDNLKFKYKILVFPVLFAIISLITFLLTVYFQKQNQLLLDQTEKVYLPSIEISIKFKDKLTATQHSLQDTLAAADESHLGETDTIARDLINLCSSLTDKVGKSNHIDSILDLYNVYYQNARSVTEGIISGDFSEELSSKIAGMVAQYNLVDSLIIRPGSKEQGAGEF